MEAVGIHNAHDGVKAGDEHELGSEHDLGVQLWRRHISPGVIAHTQSSRIWRQVTQVGQTPVANHITERFGTDNSNFRTWDSLPFVIGRRAPRIQARTIPPTSSWTRKTDIERPTGVLVHDHGPKQETDGLPTTSPGSNELNPHPNDSGYEIQRQARAVSPDSLPFLHNSEGGTLATHQVDLSDATSFSAASRHAQELHLDEGGLRDQSVLGRHEQTGSDHVLQLRRPSDFESTPRHLGNGDGAASDTSASETTPTVTSPTPGVLAEAVPSFKVLRRTYQPRETSIKTGYTGMAPVDLGTGSGQNWEELVTDGKTPRASSTASPDSPLLKHQSRTEGGTTSPFVLQPPIVQRVLQRRLPSVSNESVRTDRSEHPVVATAVPDSSLLKHKSLPEDGATSPPVLQRLIAQRVLRRQLPPISNESVRTDRLEHHVVAQGSEGILPVSEHLPAQSQSVVQNSETSDHSRTVSGIFLRPGETQVVSMRRTQTMSTQPTSATWGQNESSSSVPILVRKVQRAIHGASGLERRDERAWHNAPLPETSHSSLKENVPGSQSILPLLQVTDRPLSGSDLPPLIWRSPVSGVTTGAGSLNGLTGRHDASRFISHASPSFLARQATNPGGSHFPHPDVSPMEKLPSLAGNSASSTSVNVAEVAEQVSRFLSRQLIVERERRGVSL